jgi:AcrR family transcriptional regulator
MATDKRRAILKALEKVLQGRRYDEVTIDKVAQAAGVGKGTVYRYFKDKEDLFFQMIQEFLNAEIDAMSVVAVSSITSYDKLVRVGETMSEHVQFHGQYIRMMHSQRGFRPKQGGPPEIMIDHHQRLDRILCQLFRDAQSIGLLRSDLNLDAVLCLYKGMIMEHSMYLRQGREGVSVKQLVNLVLDGIRQIR